VKEAASTLGFQPYSSGAVFRQIKQNLLSQHTNVIHKHCGLLDALREGLERMPGEVETAVLTMISVQVLH